MEISGTLDDILEIELDLPAIKAEIARVLKVTKFIPGRYSKDRAGPAGHQGRDSRQGDSVLKVPNFISGRIGKLNFNSSVQYIDISCFK